jgi:Tfp pilus assembly protein PilO
MANPFRDMSVVMHGVYVPLSPVAQARTDLDKAVQDRTKLTQEVTQLQVYQQRYGELKQQMDALSKQLETLKTIVPEDKDTDEFIRLLQGAASASNVQLRRLTAQAIVSKEYHYEMPFEVQADGPYFNILDFFGRLSRLSRIINPGTTVAAVFTATTFFTKPADTGTAAPTGAKSSGAAAGKP